MKLFNSFLTIGLTITVLTSCTPADAQDTFRFRLSGNWTEIANELDPASPGWRLNPNAEATELPGLGDEARINWSDNTVTVDSAVPELNRILIGVNEDGTLEVNDGGVLTTTEDIVVGNNDIVDGTMNVNSGAEVNVGRILWISRDEPGQLDNVFGFLDINAGGVVNVASHLWWGVRGPATVNISGTLNQTGGILGLGTFDALTPSGGAATVTILDGGEFNLNNISGNPGTPSIQPGSSINIEGTGRMTFPNDLVGNVGEYVAAGLISGNGVPGNVDVEFVPGLLESDFNGDGTVDLLDLDILGQEFGLTDPPNTLTADANGDGTVDLLDLDILGQQFGMMGSGDGQTIVTAIPLPSLAVPEPSAFGIACVLALCGWGCSRKRT